MNWVGGARSRVRQHAEKKIQKEFFERRRLAGKVQRIKPSLSKVKTAVSQDLLFLKATASATKSKPLSPGHAARMPRPLSLERGGKDRLSMRPQRDMELPMSPIDRASSLDLMDTTTTNATFLSETLAEQGVSDNGRGLREPPKVSTQKIPHQTILDSFGPPRMNDFELHPHAGKDHAVPTEDNHILNVSTMTESLFPPPAKRRKELNMETGRLHGGAKKYSLDDMLKQNYPLSEHPKQAPKGVPVFPAQQHDKRHTSDQTQNMPDSVFAVAKGGWPGAGTKMGSQREKGKAVGYQFNFECQDRYHRDAPGVEVAAIGDCNAMLELHYATEKVMGRNYDADSSTTGDDQLIPTYAAPTVKHLGWKGKSKLDKSCQQDVLPWLSSTKSVSSDLSEDPFSGRKIPHLFAGPPVSTSVDFDESVFGPLRHKDANGGHPLHHEGNSLYQGDKDLHHKGHPVCHRERYCGDTTGPLLTDRATSLNTTQYNESILAPIRNAKKAISTTQGDVDESILAPVQAARKRGFHKLIEPGKVDKCIPGPERITQSKAFLDPVRVGASTPTRNNSSLDQARVGETMCTPAPIHGKALNGTPLGLQAQGGMGHLTPAKKNSEQISELVTARRKSAFETMMTSLEKSSMVEEGREVVEVIRGSPTFNSKGSHVQLEVYHVSDKHKRPPSYLSYECDTNASLPDSGQVSALPRCTASNGLENNSKCKAKPGNISVLHELMSLEEEIASHYEDGLLSQCSTEEVGENSEDPLFQRARGGDQKDKSKCSFASSQELAMTKLSHTKQTLNTGHTSQDSINANSPVAVGELYTVNSENEANNELKLASSNVKSGNKTSSKEVLTHCTLDDSKDSSSSMKHDSISASTTGTQTDSRIPGRGSKLTKRTKTYLESRASTGVQTDMELVCSSTQTSDSIDAKPESETSDNEVAMRPQTDREFVSSSAQTSDSLEDHSEVLSRKNGSDISDSDPIKGCSASLTLDCQDEVDVKSSELEFKASNNKCIAENGIQTDRQLLCSPVQILTSIEDGSNGSSTTNENLTIGLEKYRMAQSCCGKKREMGQFCDVACQASGETAFSEAGCDQGANSTAVVESKEMERLRQRVKELEENVLRAESTIAWQSVILKCLKLESTNTFSQ